MAYYLSDFSGSRNNNFNLLRFIAAFLVLFSHSFTIVTGELSSQPLQESLGLSWGYIAVDVFFISSGFLITGSLLRRNNLLAYTWARVLRIYPALIVAMIFSVFVIGLCFTTLPIQEYILQKKTFRYFIKNCLLIFDVAFSLPNVFLDNPHPKAINGSLWTLPYEIKSYGILAIVWFISLLIKRKCNKDVFTLIIVATAVIGMALHLTNTQWLGMNIHNTRLYTMFFVGAAIFLCQRYIILSTPTFMVLSIALIATTVHQYSFFVFYSISVAYIVLYLAYIPSGKIRSFNKCGDYSYGLYIYAFPVQQALVALFRDISIFWMIILSSIITLILSALSWHLLEKRCLRLKNSYQWVERKLSTPTNTPL